MKVVEILYNFVPKKPRGGKDEIEAVGHLAIDHDTASFMVGEGADQKTIAKLSRPVVDYIGPCGIQIKGFEFSGYDKKGAPRYYFREWYCSYYGVSNDRH